MAQTGYTPILIYSSSTAAQAPVAGNLTNSTLGSELAINITDGKLFYKDNANAVQVIGWKTVPTTAGGTGLTSYTAGDMVYYASGTAFTKLAIGASGRWLGSSGTAPQWNAPAALTKTDDTNVTLTLGGSASTALLNAASLTLGWTGTLATTRGGTGLSSFTANGVLYASSTSALATSSGLTYDGTTLTSTGTNANVQAYATTGTVRAIIRNNSRYWNFTADSTNSGALRLRDESNDTTNTTWDSAGNMTFSVGNLIQGTAAKGINFTANTPAAGMTSQLLNWYEHGTWTPVLEAENGAFGAISYNALNGGRYVRVGNMVHVQALFYTDSVAAGTASLEVRLAGLPFTAVASTGSTQDGFSSLAISQSSGWVVNQPSGAFVRANSKQINLTYRALANGNTATMNVNEVTTGSTGNLVRFAGTYFCA